MRSGLVWLLPALAATGMFFAQRGLYPASGVVEWPWRVPQNGWEQAFLWIRENTAVEERVALDARYTEVHGEDAQGFRALALRSTLPDAAKDGGVAAVVPTLQQSWLAGVSAQTGLNGAYDRQRIERLAPFGIHVLVLPASAQTVFSCPYRTTSAKVCRLP